MSVRVYGKNAEQILLGIRATILFGLFEVSYWFGVNTSQFYLRNGYSILDMHVYLPLCSLLLSLVAFLIFLLTLVRLVRGTA